jgi:branched-chain amino acid transport system permease protein
VSQFLQFLASGLAVGFVYALVGLGLVLIYQVTGVINFAQGDFVMVGALTFALLSERGWSLLPAAATGVAAATVTGVTVERLAIAPARDSSPERLIILTIGASFAIRGIALVLVGTSPHFAPPFSDQGPARVGGVVLLPQYGWVAGATIVAVLLMAFFLLRTLPGKAMRACEMNRETSRLMGISPARMSLLAFAIAAALGGLAGVILAPLQSADYGIGLALGLKGFTAAVLGGLANPAGAVAGGLLIGVIESMSVGYLSSGYKDAVTFGILLVVLLARPAGLLRRAQEVRV